MVPSISVPKKKSVLCMGATCAIVTASSLLPQRYEFEARPFRDVTTESYVIDYAQVAVYYWWAAQIALSAVGTQWVWRGLSVTHRGVPRVLVHLLLLVILTTVPVCGSVASGMRRLLNTPEMLMVN